MSIIPDKKVEQLQYFEAHWPVWVANAAGIGVLPAAANSFKSLTQAARTAYDALSQEDAGALRLFLQSLSRPARLEFKP